MKNIPAFFSGGAATGSGIDYQVDLAVWLTLMQLARIMHQNPLAKVSISIEPRFLRKNTITAWDISLEGESNLNYFLFEGKISPKKSEIIEWLTRAKAIGQISLGSECVLVHSRATNSIQQMLKKLTGLAKESNGSSDKFQDLVRLEADSDLRQILDTLGDSAYTILPHVRIWPLDEFALSKMIDTLLLAVVESKDAQRLRDHLRSFFLKGMKERISIRIVDVFEKAKGMGISFHKQAKLDPSEWPQKARHACAILQNCIDTNGLPSEVLAFAIDSKEADLEEELRVLIEGRCIHLDSDSWKMTPLHAPIEGVETKKVVAKAFEFLLELIKRNRRTPLEEKFLDTAISLAHAIEPDEPELVSGLFKVVEKALKSKGNKAQVLQVARMTINVVAKCNPRTRETAQAEAHARVCGVAWVYQRIGRLEDAKIETERSRQKGEQISWQRNTAFCVKCRGRLLRMLAEENSDENNKIKLLKLSHISLEQGIKEFEKCEEMPRAEREQEIGDSHSLLARTLFSAKNPGLAQVHLAKAEMRGCPALR